jgi:ABC-type dipeptide/oligopeptide/nickel transport system permease component
MYQYISRRSLLFVPTLLIASMLVFALFWIVPGDAAMMILTGDEGGAGRVATQDYENLRHEMGLDRPVYVQYASWLGNVLKGDLGNSTWYKEPVIKEL